VRHESFSAQWIISSGKTQNPFRWFESNFWTTRIKFWTIELNFGQPKRCCDLRVNEDAALGRARRFKCIFFGQQKRCCELHCGSSLIFLDDRSDAAICVLNEYTA